MERVHKRGANAAALVRGQGNRKLSADLNGSLPVTRIFSVENGPLLTGFEPRAQGRAAGFDTFLTLSDEMKSIGDLNFYF